MSMPFLFSLALGAALVLPQDPLEPDSTPAQESAQEPAARTHFALTGAVVHSQVPGQEPAVRTVVVQDGVIQAVLEPGVSPPEGAEVIELKGLHLTPGLIDGHVNYDVEHDALYVTNGVTLVRDAGNVVHDILQMRQPIMRDLVPGPELYICGPALTGRDEATASTWPVPNARVASEVLPRKLAELEAKAVEMGFAPGAFAFDYLYFQPDLPAEAAEALIAMAHTERDLTVWGPVPYGATLAQAVAMGQDGLVSLNGLLPVGKGWADITAEHLEPGIATLAGSGVALTPLMATTSRQLSVPADFEQRIQRLSPVYEATWRGYIETINGFKPEQRSLTESVLTLQRSALQDLWKRGVPLLPGSGAPFEMLFPGDGLLDELDQWIAAGIPSGEVLRLATAGAAEIMGLAAKRGSIAPGQVADLVALGRDPRDGSLASFRDPELVILRGRLLERWDLEDMNTALAQAQDQAREMLTRELVIAPPDLPEGELLMAGRSQTEVSGQRMAAEHFAVVDMLDGRIAYGTRMLLPGVGLRPEYEVHLVQIFKGDRLESFQLRSIPTAEVGNDDEILSWIVTGALAGGSNKMNIQRKHTLANYKNLGADRAVALVDYSDTLTALILGRHVRAGTRKEPTVCYPMNFEGNTWEPVQDEWRVVVLEDNHAVVAESKHTRTRVVAGLDAKGRPILFQREVAGVRNVQRFFGVDVFGAGAPPKAGRVFDTK